MRMAVLGTGIVGRTLAAGFAELGHDVVLGTRDPSVTSARIAPDDLPHGLRLVDFASAGQFGELFVNATNGAVSVAALQAVSEPALAGRIVVDVANPLDFGAGFPPTLLVKDTDSLGEQIQRAFPRARVVKTLNTVNAAVMVAPHLVGDGGTSLFMSGDDEEAKHQVRGLLGSLGWRDVIDLGGIATARGPEMYLALWVRLMGSLGTPAFNVAVVR